MKYIAKQFLVVIATAVSVQTLNAMLKKTELTKLAPSMIKLSQQPFSSTYYQQEGQKPFVEKTKTPTEKISVKSTYDIYDKDIEPAGSILQATWLRMKSLWPYLTTPKLPALDLTKHPFARSNGETPSLFERALAKKDFATASKIIKNLNSQQIQELQKLVEASDSSGYTTLHRIVMSGNNEILEEILNTVPFMNMSRVILTRRDKPTALDLAFEQFLAGDDLQKLKYAEIIKTLMRYGATSNKGYSLEALIKELHRQGKTFENLEKLSKEPYIGDEGLFGSTLGGVDLSIALLENNTKIIKKYINTKGLNIVTIKEILLYALKKKNAEFVRMLIEKHPNTLKRIKNLLILDGRTPLMVSADTGNKYAVKFFLLNDADTNIKDKNDYTARDYAVGNGFKEIVSMIDDAKKIPVKKAPSTLSLQKEEVNDLIKQAETFANKDATPIPTKTTKE